jgi:hypothetical protein
MSKGGEHIVIDPADREWLTRLGLTSVSRVIGYHPQTLAAISGSSETFRIDLDLGPAAPAQVYVKRYRYRGWGVRLKGMFRGTLFGKSRARFEYEFLSEMRRRKVPAVRPVCYGEKRRAGFLKACFLITEGESGQAGMESLDTFASRRLERGDLSAGMRRGLVESLARAVRQMHQAGVMHGGLFWRNIMVGRADDGTWHLRFLDPDRRGRFFSSSVPSHGIVSDLSDLAATAGAFQRRADVARFGRAYLDVRKLGSSEKATLRAVLASARKKIAREEHRIAVGGTIAWVRERVRKASRGDGEEPVRVESVGAFFHRLARLKPQPSLLDRAAGRVHFVFRDHEQGGEPDRYTLTLQADRLAVAKSLVGRANLTIETDADAWLAIINGRPDAFDSVRNNRIKIMGDTKLLPILAKLIDS